MSNDDVLVNLLDRPESRTIRKPEDILGRGKGDSDDADGYDLTNPNLHHGAEDIYRPVQSPEPLRPSPLIDAGASSATASESFYLQVGDSGATTTVIADESANEGWSSSFDVSNHFAPPGWRHPGPLGIDARGPPQHRCPYRFYLGHADQQ